MTFKQLSDNIVMTYNLIAEDRLYQLYCSMYPIMAQTGSIKSFNEFRGNVQYKDKQPAQNAKSEEEILKEVELILRCKM